MALETICRALVGNRVMVTIHVVEIREVIAETIIQVPIAGLHIENFTMSMMEDVLTILTKVSMMKKNIQNVRHYVCSSCSVPG